MLLVLLDLLAPLPAELLPSRAWPLPGQVGLGALYPAFAAHSCALLPGPVHWACHIRHLSSLELGTFPWKGDGQEPEIAYVSDAQHFAC